MLSDISCVFPMQLLLFFIMPPIIAEYCPEYGADCPPSQRCCHGGSMCCTPSDSSVRPIAVHTYDLQFGVWNLWYFWFVVIFLFMACTGACAFWRHRRRLLMAEQAALSTVSFGAFVPSRRWCPPSQISSETSRGSLSRFSYFSTIMASSPSSQEPFGEFTAPPPYLELATKSSVLPRNSYWNDLPPYPNDSEFRLTQSEQVSSRMNGACYANEPPSSRIASNLPTSPPSYSTQADALPPPTYSAVPPQNRSAESLHSNASTPSIGSGEVLISECSQRLSNTPR